MFQTSDHRLADEGPHSLNPLEVAGARTKTWIPFSTYPDIATILEDRAVSEDRSFLFTHFDQSLLPEQSRKRSSKKRKVSCVIRDPPDMHQEIIKYRDNQIMPEREVAGMSLKGEQAIQTVVHSLLTPAREHLGKSLQGPFSDHEQTMTVSSSRITSSIHGASFQKDSSGRWMARVKNNKDWQSWNQLQMIRAEATMRPDLN